MAVLSPALIEEWSELLVILDQLCLICYYHVHVMSLLLLSLKGRSCLRNKVVKGK